MAKPPQPASLSDSKRALRHDILLKRDALTADSRATASARITENILRLAQFQRAKTVLAYASIGSEFDTKVLLDHVVRGKKLVLPRVDRAAHRLRLHRVNHLDTDLQPGVWGIREPRPDVCVTSALSDIDFILVPGVAFDRHGQRLGYGAGYYDRLLPGAPRRTAVVAAAFEIQLTDNVPTGALDVAVDLVVTERAVYPLES